MYVCVPYWNRIATKPAAINFSRSITCHRFVPTSPVPAIYVVYFLAHVTKAEPTRKCVNVWYNYRLLILRIDRVNQLEKKIFFVILSGSVSISSNSNSKFSLHWRDAEMPNKVYNLCILYR